MIRTLAHQATPETTLGKTVDSKLDNLALQNGVLLYAAAHTGARNASMHRLLSEYVKCGIPSGSMLCKKLLDSVRDSFTL